MTEKALLLALIIASLFGGTQYVRAERGQAQLQTERAAHQAERAALATAAATASEKARIEDQRIVAAQRETNHEAEKFQRQAADSAVHAADAAGSMRERAAALAAATYCAPPGDPGTVFILPPTPAPGVVLADVLGRLGDEAVSLAALADQALIAGAACAAEYDSLSAAGR